MEKRCPPGRVLQGFSNAGSNCLKRRRKDLDDACLTFFACLTFLGRERGARFARPEEDHVPFRRGVRGELLRSHRSQGRACSLLVCNQSTFVGSTSARDGRAARSKGRRRLCHHTRPCEQGRLQPTSVRPDALAACALGLLIVEDCHVSPLSRMSGRQRQNTRLR